MYHRRCVICGKNFTTSRNNTVCCSDECKAIRIRRLSRAAQSSHRCDDLDWLNTWYETYLAQKKAATTRPKYKYADSVRVYQAKERKANKVSEPVTRRVCHDCGKPTANYRCPACLEKWRKNYNVSNSADNEEIYY